MVAPQIKKTMRLPPMRVLKTANQQKNISNPCLPIMSSVLSCWASSGFGTAGCAAVEQALRVCTDNPPPMKQKQVNINYQLGRFKKYLEGPTRRK